MAFTQDQLQKLEDAIAQGALRVKYADKEVTYRSLNEMLQVRDIMKKSLNTSDGTNPNRVYPTISKGLG